MKKQLIPPLFAFATSAFAAGVPSLAGQWTIHNSIGGNENQQECMFARGGRQDQRNLQICQALRTYSVQVTGSVNGKKVTWKYEMDYNGTPLTMTYTATLDDTDKVSGTFEVEPFAVSGDFTATPIRSDNSQK